MDLKNQKGAFFRHNKFSGFKSLTIEEIDLLKRQANSWTLEHQFLNNTLKQTLLYTYLNSKYPALKDDQAYLLWMFCLDKDFKLLKIYYEESTYQNIKARCLEELGITFVQNLLILEEYYNKLYPTIEDEYALKK